jgi:hypothetical protein
MVRFFKTIDNINNSNFDIIIWFSTQGKDCFKIEEGKDEYYKEAKRTFNYEGVKPLGMALKYAENLQEDIMGRTKDSAEKIEIIDAVAYIVCSQFSRP